MTYGTSPPCCSRRASPPATVQRLLRHSDPAITTEVYGHLDVEDMRHGINQLAFQAEQPAEAPELAAGDATPPLAAGG